MQATWKLAILQQFSIPSALINAVPKLPMKPHSCYIPFCTNAVPSASMYNPSRSSHFKQASLLEKKNLYRTYESINAAYIDVGAATQM